VLAGDKAANTDGPPGDGAPSEATEGVGTALGLLLPS
jgi:hypothetical protein